jgi:hypothetical protein
VPERPARVGLSKQRFKIALQHDFQFMYEQLALIPLCLQDQQEGCFEALDSSTLSTSMPFSSLETIEHIFKTI